MISECLSQQKPSEEREDDERPSWRDKPLHRIYQLQIEEVADIGKTDQWLENVGLRASTRTGLERKIDRGWDL